MSKKHKGKTCAYCGSERASETADHVLARSFVDVSLRHEIPTVPSCHSCNQKKSELEQYAATVLPFGGMQKDAARRLTDDVPKRLDRNLRLNRHIRKGMTRVWVRENGILCRTAAIPLDGTKIALLVEYITRGLIFHHWGVALDSNCQIDVLALTEVGEALFRKIRTWNYSQLARGNIAAGTLMYQGRQGTDNELVSVWEVSLFGGMRMAEGNSIATTFGVMAGPKMLFGRATERADSSLIIRPYPLLMSY